VFVKGKPHKYGIKIFFELCEAKSSYMCNSEVYEGAHSHSRLENQYITFCWV
jgi:hypothetical protein